jgi:acyl-CoA dehydrogenase
MYPISPDLQKTLATIRAFIDEEIIPLEAGFGHSMKALEPVLAEKRQKVKDLGLWLPQIDKEFGGLGLSLVEHGYVSQELGRTPLGHYVFNCQAPDAGNMEILIEYGTAEQQEQFLQPLLRGETRSCFSMTEPENAGSNPTLLSTTAVREGDSYIIDGHKWFTSSADGAAFAIVMAVTNPHHESRYQRASMIIVPTDTPGFRWCATSPSWASRATATPAMPRCATTRCACPAATCWATKGPVLSSPSSGWGRAASITVCAGWAFANGPLT